MIAMCWTLLWKGKKTEELKELYTQYKKLFCPFYPGSYEEIAYNSMTYDEYVGYIKECIKQKKEMPDIVYGEDDDEE